MHTNIYWNKTNEVGSEFALHSTCLSEVARCDNTFAARPELVNSVSSGKLVLIEIVQSPMTLHLKTRVITKMYLYREIKNIKFLGEF